MHCFRQLALTILCWTLLPSLLLAQEGLNAEQRAAIEREVTALLEKTRAPGISVAIGRKNQPCYAKGFGLADVENQVPVTVDSRFRTASIAKSLTAVLALKLAEEGKLDLDADVRTYCPDYPAKPWPITSRQLLGHLGGVRHYKAKRETQSTDRYRSVSSALSTFKDDPLLHPPGSKFLYTTFGYNLLGAAIEGSAGATFFEALQDRILAPAGMTMTVVDEHAAIIPGRVSGYVIAGPDQSAKDNDRSRGELTRAALHDTSMKIPGGGLLSTPSDLIRFACAVNGDQLVTPATKQAMWTAQQTADGKKTGYGLGWSLGTHVGRQLVSHSGGQAGTSTILVLLPESGTSVALMCNLQNLRLLDSALAIADAIDVRARKTTDYSAAVEKLKGAIQQEVEQKQIPALSIAIVDGDDTIWAEGFGFQDKEKKVAATAETIYRVGSVSKLFTDIAIMQLVEAGKIELDAPVTKYLPSFAPVNPFDVPITVRQLMTHRSGLVRESPVGHYFDPTEPTLADTVASLNQTSLVYKPDTRTKYSNAAIAVVGAVLESQLEHSHPQQVQETILQPLEMVHSSFVVTPEVKPLLATGWMWTYDGRRFEAPEFLLGTGPAGNLYSSMTDLAKFLSCLFREGETGSGQILQPETLRAMTTPVKDAEGKDQKFGIGFHVQKLDGETKIGHGGAVYGFSTQLEALPERKLGVAASAALDGSNGTVTRLADYALRLMIAVQDGQPLPKYAGTIPIPRERAADLVGTYRQSQGNDVVSITELDGKVFLLDEPYRYELRADATTGALVTDDPLGYGVLVALQDGGKLQVGKTVYERLKSELPADIPKNWQGLIGEYGWDHNTLYILEEQGQLYALIEWFYYYPLTQISENEFAFPDDYGLYHGEGLKFTRDQNGVATQVNAAEVVFARRDVGVVDGETFRIKPLKPIDELRVGARAATPPPEPGEYRSPDLVELVSLDPSIKLDIRYATTNNFTGAVFYQQPRAFLQRPAAEATVRVHQKLKPLGYGLLIHDAYRPWYVTKMFWDATPDSLKNFVANPMRGSLHNRGCAVDLTLFDLVTGEPVPMVAGYDEFSNRSFPLYPGGTSRQRWHRELLRKAMESEGFTVYEYEWWHFNYPGWKEYRIGNLAFDEIPVP